MTRVLVIGATGDVGQGVVAAARERDWSVIAAGRDPARLSALATDAKGIAVAQGDLSSEDSAQALWARAVAPFGGVDAIVVSVNAPNAPRGLADWSSEALADLYASNVLTHFNAAKTFLPLLPREGVFIGIGGGTADFIIPGLAPLSMAQAALRMFYNGLARENREGPAVRELMIVSMVNGASKRDTARPDWIHDIDVGRRVCEVIAAPGDNPGPILKLTAPDAAPSAKAAS